MADHGFVSEEMTIKEEPIGNCIQEEMTFEEELIGDCITDSITIKEEPIVGSISHPPTSFIFAETQEGLQMARPFDLKMEIDPEIIKERNSIQTMNTNPPVLQVPLMSRATPSRPATLSSQSAHTQSQTALNLQAAQSFQATLSLPAARSSQATLSSQAARSSQRVFITRARPGTKSVASSQASFGSQTAKSLQATRSSRATLSSPAARNSQATLSSPAARNSQATLSSQAAQSSQRILITRAGPGTKSVAISQASFGSQSALSLQAARSSQATLSSPAVRSSQATLTSQAARSSQRVLITQAGTGSQSVASSQVVLSSPAALGSQPALSSQGVLNSQTILGSQGNQPVFLYYTVNAANQPILLASTPNNQVTPSNLGVPGIPGSAPVNTGTVPVTTRAIPVTNRNASGIPGTAPCTTGTVPVISGTTPETTRTVVIPPGIPITVSISKVPVIPSTSSVPATTRTISVTNRTASEIPGTAPFTTGTVPVISSTTSETTRTVVIPPGIPIPVSISKVPVIPSTSSVPATTRTISVTNRTASGISGTALFTTGTVPVISGTTPETTRTFVIPPGIPIPVSISKVPLIPSTSSVPATSNTSSVFATSSTSSVPATSSTSSVPETPSLVNRSNSRKKPKLTVNPLTWNTMFCCVYGCQFDSKKHPDIMYFPFPREKSRIQLWLQLIQRPDLSEDYEQYFVCEKHFHKTDINKVSELKKNVCPKYYLPKNRWNNQAVQSTTSTSTLTTSTSVVENSKYTQTTKSLEEDHARVLKLVKKQLNDCREQLKGQDSPRAMKETFDNLCDHFLSQKLADLIKAQSSLKDHHMEKGFSTSFKMFCLYLYRSSPQAYSMLEKAFFLPSGVSLSRLQIPVTTEVSDDLIEKLKIKVDSMTDLERNCTVVVESLDLTSNLFYSIINDKIIGLHEVDGVQSPFPANMAVVVIVQGLFVRWTQPVGYALLSEKKNYDNDASIWLLKILDKMIKVGLKIRTFLSNVETIFSDLAEKHNVSVERPYFIVNEAKIYYIFDSRQLLIELRDNFMQYNICFQGDSVAKIDHVKQFHLEDRKKNIKIAQKLTIDHISPNLKKKATEEKRKLDYATELFSKPVAIGISTYIDFSVLNVSASHTVKFLLLIDELYETLNSMITLGNTRKIEFLRDMLTFFHSLKLINPKNGKIATANVQFIQNFHITIASVLSLIKDLKLENHKCLSMSYLNLDRVKMLLDKIPIWEKCGAKPPCPKFVTGFRKLYLAFIKQRPKNNQAKDVVNFILQLNEFNDSITDSGAQDECALINEKENCRQFQEVLSSTYINLKIPEDTSFFYFTEFIFKKCVERHEKCQILKSKLDMSESLHDFPEFIMYVEKMEKIFRDAFSLEYIDRKIATSLYEQIQSLSFCPPCPCFPAPYFQKLYIRSRMFLAVQYNNKNLRLFRRKKDPTFLTDKLS